MIGTSMIFSILTEDGSIINSIKICNKNEQYHWLVQANNFYWSQDDLQARGTDILKVSALTKIARLVFFTNLTSSFCTPKGVGR